LSAHHALDVAFPSLKKTRGRMIEIRERVCVIDRNSQQARRGDRNKEKRKKPKKKTKTKKEKNQPLTFSASSMIVVGPLT